MLRDVTSTDWPAVLRLANASVAHVPEAGPQDEWYHNRRTFDPGERVQTQYVFEKDGELLGYGAVESNPQGEFRMFLVTEPVSLQTVGEALYDRAMLVLADRDAARVWFTEYANDTSLLEFAETRGFTETDRFVLPSGAIAVRMCRDLEPRP